MARLFAGDLRTGLIRVRHIPAFAGDCEVTVNAAGIIQAQVKLPLKDPDTGVAIPFRSHVTPLRSYLAYEEGGIVYNAGPIWTDDYDVDTHTLTLRAAGLRSYWDYRYVMALLDDMDPDDLPAGTVSFTGLSLRTIAKRLVQNAQAQTGGEVPVDYEADILGDNDRNYLAQDYHRTNEKLQQLSGVINGPDIALRPYITTAGTHLRWNLVTGDSLLAQAKEHKFDTTAAGQVVRSAKVQRNATAIVTDAFLTGSSDEETGELLQAKSHDNTLIDADYPRMERQIDNSSVINVPVLQEQADGVTASGRALLEQWSFDANLHVEPKIGTYLEGDYCKLVLKGSPITGDDYDPDAPAEDIDLRILTIKLKLGDGFASITAMPRREEIA